MDHRTKLVLIVVIVVVVIYWVIRKLVFQSYSNVEGGRRSYDPNSMRGTLILYAKPTCSWCVKFKPVWNDLQEYAIDDQIHMIEIDGSANPHIAKGDGISAYPTIRFVTPDGNVTDYKGERTVVAIREFISQASN